MKTIVPLFFVVMMSCGCCQQNKEDIKRLDTLDSRVSILESYKFNPEVKVIVRTIFLPDKEQKKIKINKSYLDNKVKLFLNKNALYPHQEYLLNKTLYLIGKHDDIVEFFILEDDAIDEMNKVYFKYSCIKYLFPLKETQ